MRVSPRIDEIPFDSVRKRMSTLHALPGGGYRLMVKGAPDVVLPRCSALPGGAPLTPARRRDLTARSEEMAARALRVLAVAWRDAREKPASTQLQMVLWANILATGAVLLKTRVAFQAPPGSTASVGAVEP